MESHQNKASGPQNSERESLSDFKRRMREKKKIDEMERADYLQDEYEKSMNCGSMSRKATGLIYDDDMTLHKCEWDQMYPEKPERYTAVMDRMKELGLVDRCKQIKLETFKHEEILRVHDVQQLVKLKRVSSNYDIVEAEEIASNYDAIYFNEHTYDCALLANNATLSLAKAVWRGDVQNGMAVVRPPGHHAQSKQYNGYCFFNNVAVAAQYLRVREKVEKILIVDFDVHHGQGTQQMFYDDKNVLYFSIHRYEHGAFWPSLKESNFNFIGKGPGAGFNINVPLNVTGCSDSEYLAILTHILLPVAYEPDIILFSAGYDACIGCPEGQMTVSPGFYGHLITLLSGLANGKLAVVLEGGYFLPSLAEGASMTLRALLDDRPAVLLPLVKPKEEVISTINDLKYILRNYWGCFKCFKTYDLVSVEKLPNAHRVHLKYAGEELSAPFETRNCYPVQSDTQINYYTSLVDNYKRHYGNPRQNTVCYGYHDDMALHRTALMDNPIENPQRLQVVYNRFLELQLQQRCTLCKPSNVDVERLVKNSHASGYASKIFTQNEMKFKSLDMYWDAEGSKLAITMAVKTLTAVADAVMRDEYTSGAAIIRPPGHHAEKDRCLGFCFVNNVAVTANYIIEQYNVERILILDFDIHHGNGTQKMFYDTNKVLYMSIHKFEHGLFFPSSKDAEYTRVGSGPGEGYNVNIPFNLEKMGDGEYLSAFFRIVLPTAYSYAPEVIIVSAGFDAGINDLLGNYKVLPETFGHMVQLLRPLAGGRIILAMEGGYNLSTLKHSMCFCVKALLGDPLPRLTKVKEPNGSACRAIGDSMNVHRSYWPCLNVDRPLCDSICDLDSSNRCECFVNPDGDLSSELMICNCRRLLESATIFHD